MLHPMGTCRRVNSDEGCFDSRYSRSVESRDVCENVGCWKEEY